jgi:predicted short-subunit dehydrogenase-like oxidoreductase (DUF2520 family)
VAKTLRERATELGTKVLGKVLEDPRRAEAIANVVGGLQKAKSVLDEAQDKALHAAGLVTRGDFKAAGKRLSQLKRRCAELADELDRLLVQRR